MALTFEIAIKDYFNMDNNVKHLIWRIIMREARARQNGLNNNLNPDEDLFTIDEVLHIMISEYEALEWYEAIQATIDCAEYYDIDIN